MVILGAFSRAAQITLSTTAPPGDPVVVDPGSVSESLLVQLSNDTSTDADFDQLSAWQPRLRIAPTDGAQGAVEFNSPSENAVVPPPDYVFAAGTNWDISVTKSAYELLAFDFNRQGVGSQVPNTLTPSIC